MSTIKGQNLRVFVDGDVVFEAVSCTISLNGQAESSSHKDVVGNYDANEIVGRSWSCSVDTINESYISVLISTINAMEPVTLMWDQTSTTDNQTQESAGFSRTGSALLTDVSIQASVKQNVSITAQFTGKGEITS